MNTYAVDPNWCFEKPQEAAAELERLHRLCDELKAERDALAARSERLERLFKRGFDSGSDHELDAWEAEAKKVLAETPATSLARQKLLWQAEALEEAAERLALAEYADTVRNHLRVKADKLRRQTEEPTEAGRKG